MTTELGEIDIDSKYVGKMFHQLIEGDSLFIDEDYEKAIDLYNDGLLLIEEGSQNSLDVNGQQWTDKIQFLLLSHLCSAYFKIDEFEKGYSFGNRALELFTKKAHLKENINETCIQALYQKIKSAKSFGVDAQEITAQMKSNDEKMEELVVEEVETPKVIPKKAATKSSKKTLPVVPKYQYYQSDTMMTIAILEPSVDPSNLSVQFFPKKLIVRLTKEEHTFTVIYGALFDTVIVEKCKVKYMDEKVLIKLRKKSKMEWHELFGTENDEDEQGDNDITTKSESKSNNGSPAASASASASGNDSTTVSVAATTDSNKPSKPSPYASNKDWNAIERDLKKQEASEKPEGDEALNKLFQDIYGRSSDDTRRAMVKSFQTSGGTVLSTNWNEVKDANYEEERQAPKGMEWKNWEGDRLKQKE